MAISKEILYKLVDVLENEDKKAAFDFMQLLIERSKKKPTAWEKIDDLEPDEEPLTEIELEQLKEDGGFISGENVKREFGLQIDLP